MIVAQRYLEASAPLIYITMKPSLFLETMFTKVKSLSLGSNNCSPILCISNYMFDLPLESQWTINIISQLMYVTSYWSPKLPKEIMLVMELSLNHTLLWQPVTIVFCDTIMVPLLLFSHILVLDLMVFSNNAWLQKYPFLTGYPKEKLPQVKISPYPNVMDCTLIVDIYDEGF